MYNKDKISIIIPVYKVEGLLEKCVDSVIEQTYTNIEIILVDDGSPDNCGMICEVYKKKDNRIKVIHKKNGGLSSARNAGLEIATGDYIGFVDSDDMISQNMYEDLYNAMIQYDSDISICGYYEVINGKCIIPFDIERTICYSNKEAVKELLNDKTIKCFAWNKLYKKTLFNKIEFPEGRNFEDVYVMHKLFNISKKIVLINKYCYFYLQREGSITQNFNSKNRIDYFNAHMTRLKDLKSEYPENVDKELNETVNAGLNVFYYSSRKKWKEEELVEIREFLLNSEIVVQYKGYISLKLKKLLNIFKYSPRLYKIIYKTFINIKKNKIIRKLYYKFEYFSGKNSVIKICREKEKDNRIFVIGTPEYNNLGDHAIAYAELEFLQKNFSGSEIIEITEKSFIKNYRILKKIIKNKDIIVLQGGGNMGSQYCDQEILRKRVIKTFFNNKVVLFPQTIYFSEDKHSNKILKKMQKYYGNHSKLVLTAREEESYNLMKKYFPNNKVIMTPDIVFSLNIMNKKVKRNGVTVSLRSDVEGVLESEDIWKINNILCEEYRDVYIKDTCTKQHISRDDRCKELNKIWNQFSCSQVVVTDRLHGMIFAVITSTPCVVFRNYNHKIIESYKWIKNLGNVVFCTNIENLKQDIKEAVNNKKEYDIELMEKHYNELIKEIYK